MLDGRQLIIPMLSITFYVAHFTSSLLLLIYNKS